jgi:hypothetical protein
VKPHHLGFTTCLPVLALLLCALIPTKHVRAGDGQQASSIGTSVQNSWVTVTPEFPGAINNPFKGFRSYQPGGYSLFLRFQKVHVTTSAIDASNRVSNVP